MPSFDCSGLRNGIIQRKINGLTGDKNGECAAAPSYPYNKIITDLRRGKGFPLASNVRWIE